MDPNRFDSITRAFTSRLSRRSAVRAGGAGIATLMVASVGIGSTQHVAAVAQTGTPFSAIRKYTLNGAPDAAIQALNTGYLPQLQQQAGYLGYTVVSSTPNTLTTVTIFDSQADFTAAEQALSGWVSNNLAQLLPAAAEDISGNAVIYDVNANAVCGGPAPTPTSAACTGDGCACNAGVQNNCDDGLTCCQTGTPIPGGPGICTAEDACAPAACTGIGCACNGGVEGACDDGLVCCQSAMGGGSMPGGAGMCAAADACGDEATPVT